MADHSSPTHIFVSLSRKKHAPARSTPSTIFSIPVGIPVKSLFWVSLEGLYIEMHYFTAFFKKTIPDKSHTGGADRASSLRR